MVSQDKVEAVEKIKEQLEGAEAAFLTEYRGLSVTHQQELRRRLRAAEAEYKVMKMSLARRAAGEVGMEELAEWLAGPTAIALAHGDPVQAAKALKTFSNEHEALVLKAAFVEGRILPPEQVSRLADIEPREVLLAQVVGAMEALLAQMVAALSSFTRNAASAFAQLLEKKESEPAPPSDEPPDEPEPAPPSDEPPDEPEPEAAEPAEPEEPEAGEDSPPADASQEVSDQEE